MSRNNSDGSIQKKRLSDAALTPKQVEELKLMLVGKMEVVGQQEEIIADYAKARSDEIGYMLIDLNEAMRAFDDNHPARTVLNNIQMQLNEIKLNLRDGQEDEDQGAYIQKINDLYHPVELLIEYRKKGTVTSLEEHKNKKK